MLHAKHGKTAIRKAFSKDDMAFIGLNDEQRKVVWFAPFPQEKGGTSVSQESKKVTSRYHMLCTKQWKTWQGVKANRGTVCFCGLSGVALLKPRFFTSDLAKKGNPSTATFVQ